MKASYSSSRQAAWLVLAVSLFSHIAIAATTVAVSLQVSSNPAPSLASIPSENVRVALNFGGSSLTRDGIAFIGITATSPNPFTNTVGDYKVVVWAPSGSLSYATAGSDALFNTFIWAGVQNSMGVRIEGLDPAKDYNIYYLCGDNRSSFNMVMNVSATNGVQTASGSGLISWGGNTNAYLPVYVNDATVVDAQMSKNGNSLGVAFSGVIVAEATNIPPTLTSVSLAGAVEDHEFTITYDSLTNAADEADAEGNTISFLVSNPSNGTLQKSGTNITSAWLSAGETVVWKSYINATNSTVQAFTVKAYDGMFLSASNVPVMVNVAASLTNQPMILLTNSIVSLVNAGTTNYTFTDTNSGAAVTIAVTIAADGITDDDYFTLLDAINSVPTRVGLGVSGNWIDAGEKVKFSASVVSSTTNVAADSIRFRVAAVGARNSGSFTNISTADTVVTVTSGSETLVSLDRFTAPIHGTNVYASELTANTNYQLSDRTAYGVAFSARFTVADPSPSVTLERVSGGLKISWPETAGYVLQQVIDLAGSWGDASPSITNGSVMATSGEIRFFKLTKP
jgi:hypothetical protein